MTDVTDLERRGLLAHMHLKARERRRAKADFTIPRKHARPPELPSRQAGRHLGQIRALWRTLGYLGALAHDDEQALKSYIQREIGVPHPAALTPEQGSEIITRLKSWAAREGVEWPGAHEGRTPGMGERRAVALCLWGKLCTAGLVLGPSEEAMATYLSHAGLPFTTRGYSFADWDKALALLGKMWRPQAIQEKARARHG